jgi:hypothetical protein
MNLAKASPSATAGLIPNPKARLLDQVREVLRFHHFRGTNIELSPSNVERRTKAGVQEVHGQ